MTWKKYKYINSHLSGYACLECCATRQYCFSGCFICQKLRNKLVKYCLAKELQIDIVSLQYTSDNSGPWFIPAALDGGIYPTCYPLYILYMMFINSTNCLTVFIMAESALRFTHRQIVLCNSWSRFS